MSTVITHLLQVLHPVGKSRLLLTGDAVRGDPTQCTLSGGGCHLNLGESAEVQLRSLLWSGGVGKAYLGCQC